MKPTLLMIAAGLFALAASAQNPPARTGAPHAWGDKNKDGICDVTGKPVGQGRAQAGGRRMGCGRGQMRGKGNCCAQNQAPAAGTETKK